MMPRGFPPPPRQRTPSGHDVPIPESVFHALQGLQGAVQDLATSVSVGKADTDRRLAGLELGVAKVAAANTDRWVNLLKVVVPAVATIIGGTVGVQRLTAPEPPPPETRTVRSSTDWRLAECRGLKPGSAERQGCVDHVLETER